MSFFTLDAAADDNWIDVKTKEEVLKSELDKTKEDLERRQHKLDVTSLEVDLLKGHKTNLETLREDLQSQLREREYALSKTVQDLEDVSQKKEFLKQEFARMKESLEHKNSSLEKSLSSLKDELEGAYGEVTKLKAQVDSSDAAREKETKEAGDAVSSLKQSVTELESKLPSLQSQSAKDKLAIDRAQLEIKAQSTREEQLQKDLTLAKNAMMKTKKELEETQKGLGSVAVLAEELKKQKQMLEHALQKREEELKMTSNNLEQSKAREAAVSKEMVNLRLSSENSINDLHTSLSNQADTLEDRKDRIEYLQQVLEGFKTQHEIMEQKLLDAQSSLDRERTLNVELKTKNSEMENEMKTQEEKYCEDLKEARNSSKRMVELESQFDHQALLYKQRADELQQILGEGFFAPIISMFKAWPGHPHVKLQ